MSLAFENISHSYDSGAVLSDVSFTAHAGQVSCLLGPSGCGKTTLLRLAAGLLPVQSGAILLHDEPIATAMESPPPEHRPIGLVFQEGALFPHLTVWENVMFGIGREADAQTRAKSLLDQVGLSGFEDRFPNTLSGGQQQRVALARALAPAPKVLLLDEPFANIDSQLRRILRQDTRRMLVDSEAIAILVTHDPDEALDMADQIVVLRDGRVLQHGTPDEVFDTPAAAEIAQLFGNGQPVAGMLSPDTVHTPFGDWPVSCLTTQSDLSGEVDLIVRPDSLTLSPNPEVGFCSVVDVRRRGASRTARVLAPNGEDVTCSVALAFEVARGDMVTVVPRTRSVFVFPKQS